MITASDSIDVVAGTPLVRGELHIVKDVRLSFTFEVENIAHEKLLPAVFVAYDVDGNRIEVPLVDNSEAFLLDMSPEESWEIAIGYRGYRHSPYVLLGSYLKIVFVKVWIHE